MKVLVTHSARFESAQDGKIYPQGPLLDYGFFRRYLEVFDEVEVVARVRKAPVQPENVQPSDGPGIKFVEIPNFYGIMGLGRSYPKIRAQIDAAISRCQAFILRVPDPLGNLAWYRVSRFGLPLALEVVSDPYEALKPGSGVDHPLLPLLQRVYVYCLRRQCQKACAAAYVTKHYLQRLYPPGIHTHTTHYSSINLSPALFAAKPRRYSEPATRLIFVGTLERLYKGQDLLTEAIALLKKRGHKVHLTFVGDGRCRSDLERMAANLDLASSITFLGKVPAGEGVAAVLDAAELFILPSKSEGLPRAMIEAMARGLPCIGTSIAGIPELLPPEDMVPPGDLRALVQKIEEVITDPGRMTAMAERNLLAAQEYRQEFIESRRRDFYRYIYTNCAPRAAARNSP